MMSNGKKALITGITGQDGAYLAKLLLAKGYQVHGLLRRSSAPNIHRLEHVFPEGYEKAGIHLHYGDLTDTPSLIRIMQNVEPDEVYNLAAQSHVAVSFETPEYTANADGVGVLRLLEAIRSQKLSKTRFYQASTSELYGLVREIPQSETTPFYPRSPYGVAKLYGYWITVNYREAYDMHASNGILFNHEGPLRGELFVTRKITKAVAQIKIGSKEPLLLGNLDAERDWGDAEDYVRGMWLILQQDQPDDYVLATGEKHTVREFVELAFKAADINIAWSGSGIDEVGHCQKTGQLLVKIDPKYFRPAEVELLVGNPAKAKAKLGWTPQVSFHQLVQNMVEADIGREQRKSQQGASLSDFV